jgi:hypothetical protein
MAQACFTAGYVVGQVPGEHGLSWHNIDHF